MHKLIETTTLLLGAGMTAVLYYTFISAYIDEGKKTTIYINAFGEANADLVLLSLITLFVIMVTVAKVLEVYCDGKRVG